MREEGQDILGWDVVHKLRDNWGARGNYLREQAMVDQWLWKFSLKLLLGVDHLD